MLEKRPEIFTAIPTTAWTLLATGMRDRVDTTPLMMLARTDEGLSCLLKLKDLLIDRSDIVSMINELIPSTGENNTTYLTISTSPGSTESMDTQTSRAVSTSTSTLLEVQGLFQTRTSGSSSGDTVTPYHSLLGIMENGH